MDYNQTNLTNLTNITNSTNSTNWNFEPLNTYITAGFLFVVVCLNFTNLLHNHINLKWLKKKLNSNLSMKEIYDKILKQYASTDKIQDKKNILIERRKSSIKETPQIFKEADLKDIELN